MKTQESKFAVYIEKPLDNDYLAIIINAYAFCYDKLDRMKLAGYGSCANGTTWND